MRPSDRQRRGMFAAMAARDGQVRSGLRSAGRHIRRWSRDPELREAAGHLAVLGGAALALKYGTPPARHLQYQAIRKWRALAPAGTPGRKMLMQWVFGLRKMRTMPSSVATRSFDARQRLQKRGLSIAALKKTTP